MDDKKELLNEAICSLFSELKSVSKSEDKRAIIDNINTLYRIHIDEDKDQHNFEEKMGRLNMEKSQYDDGAIDRRDDLQLRRDELDEQTSDRKWKNGIAIGTCVVTSLLNLAALGAMFEFEKDGSFTLSLRNAITNNIFKHKK